MEDKRRVNEVIALYELEPNLNDIYVEGITDKLVVERFLQKYRISDVNVIMVEDIEFSAMYDEHPDIICNNKRKLVVFCKLLGMAFQNALEGIAVIVDRDFDEIKGALQNNHYIHYTDYNSLELYLFDENVLNIFYRNILKNFPYNGKYTLDIIGPILIEKFLIRLVLEINGPFPKEKITDLYKSISVDKNTGVIKFDPEHHLDKILNNIKKTKDKADFIGQIEEFRKKLSAEKRRNIRGHDFIHLLFGFINKIKNNIHLNEETLERSIFQCIDYSELRKEILFSTLEKKYKDLAILA